MKIIFSSIIFLTLFISCGDKEIPVNNNTIDQNTVQSISKTDQKSTKSGITVTNADGFSTFLQGKWERISYPNSTIEFDGPQLKTTAGEGERSESKVQNYKFADSCEKEGFDKSAAQYQDYIVLDGDSNCAAIKVINDTLSINFKENSEEIRYTRIKSRKSVVNSISTNMLGTWILEEGNCANNDDKRITVSANKVTYKSGNFNLRKITEYEPTRIVADYNFTSSSGENRKNNLILDLQENGSQLIIREYGEQARAGVFKYTRCK